MNLRNGTFSVRYVMLDSTPKDISGWTRGSISVEHTNESDGNGPKDNESDDKSCTETALDESALPSQGHV